MSEELHLKNCPFCGGEAEVRTYRAPTVEEFFWCACTNCQAQSPPSGDDATTADAVSAWNTRWHPPVDDDDAISQAFHDAYLAHPVRIVEATLVRTTVRPEFSMEYDDDESEHTSTRVAGSGPVLPQGGE